MTIYIAILRGINVGGKRMIKMDDLKRLLATLDLQNPLTYIQSGNVVFQSNATADQLQKNIAIAIETTYGFEVPVLVFAIDELKKIIANNPLAKEKDKAEEYWHVTFLAEKPTLENWQKINPAAYLPDAVAIKDRAVYLHCPNGYSNSKLTNSFLEKQLKTTATTRNWKTTLALLDLAAKL